MSRIHTPTVEEAAAASQSMLAETDKRLPASSSKLESDR